MPLNEMEMIVFRRMDALLHAKYPYNVANPWPSMRLINVKKIKEGSECSPRILSERLTQLNKKAYRLEAGWYYFEYEMKDYTHSKTQNVPRKAFICNNTSFSTYNPIPLTTRPANRQLFPTPWPNVTIFTSGQAPTYHYQEVMLAVSELSLTQGIVWLDSFPTYAAQVAVAATGSKVRFVVANSAPERSFIKTNLAMNSLRDRTMLEEEVNLPLDEKY